MFGRAHSRSFVLGAAVVLGVVVAGSVAYATIPDSSGMIHGCYKLNQGTLRVIDTEKGDGCLNSEAAISWTQTGLQGQQGPPGPPGAKGDKGDKGDPGQPGAGTPIGAVIAYAGSVAPSGWLVADGSAVDRTAYAALFSAVGTTYGAGNGSTTFNLPDLRGRGAVGIGSNAAVASLGQSENLAEDARSPEHTHSIPAHYHGRGTLTVNPAGNHAHLVETSEKRVCGTGCSVASELLIEVPRDYNVNDIFNAKHTTSPEGTHSHSLSGTVGNSASGVDGDQAMTSGAAGPSYITLNYIIRAT